MRVLQYNELDTRGLSAQFDRALEALRRGNFRAASVKKLGGTPFYRAKLSDADRLLFRFGAFQSERCLLVLEIVRNHDYGASRFLNGAAVHEDKLVDVDDAAQAPAADDLPMAYVHPHRAHFHVLDKIVSLDDIQQEVYGLRLPLILIGSAGSGKTILTLERIKQLSGDLLYVTLSSYLADNARRLYYANGYENESQELDFLSYREFIETLGVPKGRLVEYRVFAGWFARHRIGAPLKNAHQLFEEFNGVLMGGAMDEPYLSEEDYLGLGVRQSIFLGEERPAVYALFRKYLQFLREDDCYDLNLISHAYRERARPAYDTVVIDEAQDFTPRQLALILKTLRHPAQFLLCGDSNQIVHPTFFSWSKVKSFFYEERLGGQAEIVRVLNANYRNSPPVTALANRILRVKNARFGSIDKESHYLARCVSETEGAVELLEDSDQVRRDVNARTGRSARFAVLTLRPDEKEAARRLFVTPLVFSIQEAKGLEYENIILYNFVSGAAREFEEIIRGVTADDVREDAALEYGRARDKADKSLEAYKFFVNALYVAVSRAVARVYWIERNPRHPLLNLLEFRAAGTQVKIREQVSTADEWKAEARRLEMQGKEEQADLIRSAILQTQPVPWRVLTPGTLADLEREAFDPAHFNKQAKTLLYEYAVTCSDMSMINRLVEFHFTRALSWREDEPAIRRKYAMEYENPRFTELRVKMDRHGVDFRNPLNQTPLMMAAWLGKADLARILLDLGANPNLRDNWGRIPLQIALREAYRSDAYARGYIGHLYHLLAPDCIKVKVDNRLHKIDAHRMEFFMLHSMIALFQYMMCKEYYVVPGFQTADFVKALEHFPDHVIPARRKVRAYLSHILAKNELYRDGPYNFRLFVRVRQGHYLPNPGMEIEAGGEWIGVYDLIRLEDKIGALDAPSTQNMAYFIERIKREIAAAREAEAGPVEPPPPPSISNESQNP